MRSWRYFIWRSFQEERGDSLYHRAWKGHDWEALDRLHKKGLISDPKNKAKSITFSAEGYNRAEELFEKLFSSSK